MTFVFSINAFIKAPDVFYKKLLLKISQYSQKNNCVGVSSNMDVFLWILQNF